jgi:hypothetical protein
MASLNNQPVANVEWVPRDSITPNDYNPNHQAPPEHRLLQVSILEDGWTQLIVVFDDDEAVSQHDSDYTEDMDSDAETLP